jgi:hypothetical protein
MNKLAVVTSLTVMIFASSCATNKDQANNKLNNDPDVLSNSSDSSKSEKYVQVIDELISNGCNISTFELINRKNTLDMKVSCK